MSLDIWLSISVDAGGKEPTIITLFDANITHNLVPMWVKTGVYDALYNSADKQASEILEVLKLGYADMKARPEEYSKLNASNGWGKYEEALPWLKEFLDACEKYPRSVIGLWK